MESEIDIQAVMGTHQIRGQAQTPQTEILRKVNERNGALNGSSSSLVLVRYIKTNFVYAF